MPEPGAREEETFSYLKAYTVQVTFTDAADAEQYTRLLIEDGTKVRRKGTSAIVYDLVLPWPDDDPDEHGRTSLARFLKQYVETDVFRAFEADVVNGLRSNYPTPYWQIVDSRQPTRKEQTDLEETRKVLESIDWEAARETAQERFAKRRTEDRLVEDGLDVLEKLDREIDSTDPE